MKKLLVISLLCSLFIGQAFAHSVGLALGNPTGINGQYYLSKDRVIEGTGGIELGQGSSEFVLDYYKKQEDKYYLQAYDMDFYYGGGIKFKKGFGINGSISTAHPIAGQQLELFASSGLTAYFLGQDGLELDVYAGIRYTF